MRADMIFKSALIRSIRLNPRSKVVATEDYLGSVNTTYFFPELMISFLLA